MINMAAGTVRLLSRRFKDLYVLVNAITDCPLLPCLRCFIERRVRCVNDEPHLNSSMSREFADVIKVSK